MKNGIRPYLTAALLLFAVNPGPLSADVKQQKGEAYTEIPASQQDIVLRQTTERLQSVKTLKAEFVQERHLAAFMDTLTARGILYFEVPDRLRWELAEPYISLLVFNGGYAAKFNGENGRLVKKMKLGMEDLIQGVMRQMISIMRGDFNKIRETYNISLLRGKDYRFVMTPVSSGTARVIKSLELFIDPASSRMTKIVIREPQGDYIEIRFSGEEDDLHLDRNLFDLNAPIPPRGLKTAGNR